MYTLVNGKKVENLTYIYVGSVWEISPYFWYEGKMVCEMFNSETGEIKWVDVHGKEAVNF